MPETSQRNYQSCSNMNQEVAAVLWKTFCVFLAGETNRAHEDIVKNLKSIGHTEVKSPEESDYLLVFCPVVSRVQTDITEALEHIPGGKPIILVVMHHTFDPDHIVPQSRRDLDNPKVKLTVNCLFHKGKILKCNRNEIIWSDIQKLLGVSKISPLKTSWADFTDTPWLPALAVLLGLGVLIIVLVVVIEETFV